MLEASGTNGCLLNARPLSLAPADSLEDNDKAGLFLEHAAEGFLAVGSSEFFLPFRVDERRDPILQPFIELRRGVPRPGREKRMQRRT